MSDKSNNVLMTKTKVIFTVNDFDVNRETVFRSEDFTIGSNVWQIIIYTNYMDEKYNEPMVAINLESKSKNNFFVRFDSIIYNSNMKQIYHSFEQKFVEISPNWWLPNDIVSQQKFMAQKDSIFPNKTLIIGAIISVESKDIYEGIPRIISYRNTFNVKQFNDLHIICGTKESFVSKALLISQSEVFHKMFSNEMREQNSNQLIIEDIDGEVFEEFLKFIYFGNSDKLEELKEELLFIADKYQILDLKKICENLMFIEIHDSNAIKLLITFDKYNCIQMTEKTIEFISKNLLEIKNKTPNEWKEFTERYNQLLVRITERMAQLIKCGLISDAINDCIKSYTYSYIK